MKPVAEVTKVGASRQMPATAALTCLPYPHSTHLTPHRAPTKPSHACTIPLRATCSKLLRAPPADPELLTPLRHTWRKGTQVPQP